MEYKRINGTTFYVIDSYFISDTKITIGDRLRQLMKEKNVTQNDIAELLKVDRSLISKYILGKRKIHKDYIKILATYFDVDIKYLLCEQIPKKNINHDITTGVYYDSQISMLEYPDFLNQKTDKIEKILCALGYENIEYHEVKKQGGYIICEQIALIENEYHIIRYKRNSSSKHCDFIELETQDGNLLKIKYDDYLGLYNNFKFLCDEEIDNVSNSVGFVIHL